VADVAPFRALRYAEEAAGPLGRLVAPPYDVIGPDERRALLARSPFNAVHLILPEIAYEEVGALIAEWRASGALRRAQAPELVAWTQTFSVGGRRLERRTLLAAVGLEAYERGVVRPHERTHAGPRDDRLRLTRAVRANLSPVFGLYPDAGGGAWAAARVEGPPDAELTDDEGTTHRVWRLADPARAADVAETLAERWILIADGHHRYETALAYREEHPEAGRVMMGLTALEDPGLVVLPTHRVLARWPDRATAGFEVRPVGGPEGLVAALDAAPHDVAALGLVRPDGAALLTRPVDGGPAASRLDTVVLEREILVPGLGADQAELSARGALDYVKDADDAARRVREGTAAAAVLVRAPTTAQIAAVAEARETMPQKTTYFFPKLLTGIAFHLLDEPNGDPVVR
jgi:uncharacterized protein (DUF1015 family)